MATCINIGSCKGPLLSAQIHYLNQCWLIIKDDPWHSPASNFLKISIKKIKIHCIEQKSLHLRGQWVKVHLTRYQWAVASHCQRACIVKVSVTGHETMVCAVCLTMFLWTNCPPFAGDIFKCSWNKFYVVKIHSLKVKLTMKQHCVWPRFVVIPTTNHYLSQWRTNSLTHVYVTGSRSLLE